MLSKVNMERIILGVAALVTHQFQQRSRGSSMALTPECQKKEASDGCLSKITNQPEISADDVLLCSGSTAVPQLQTRHESQRRRLHVRASCLHPS
jgi:hypothetical protein